MFILKKIYLLARNLKFHRFFAETSENLLKFFFYHARVTTILNNLEKLLKGNLSFPRKDKKNPWHAVDFEPFIIEFTKNPKILYDRHFLNFVSEKSLSPCENYYNLIVKQEFLSEELGFLTEHLKMNLTNVEISDFHHSNKVLSGLEALQKHAHFYLDPLTVETREKLFNYFKNDLQIFGYTYNYKTNEITL